TNLSLIAINDHDAGRGLQPRPKRLNALIAFETLNIRNGVANPVPLGGLIRHFGDHPVGLRYR
ncbi:MAG: hypothetical protein D0531_06475, partial [Methylococcales bacterium]